MANTLHAYNVQRMSAPAPTHSVKSFSSPDAEHTFDKAHIEVVRHGAVSFSRATVAPGWRWTECIKVPMQTTLAGTDLCLYIYIDFAILSMVPGACTECRE